MPGPWLVRARRAVLTVATALSFALLAGITYQGVATAVERRKYPYPGRMVDVGGHQLHLYCVGKGSPVVVLEAPVAGVSVGWDWVLRGLQGSTRVCSYDRAGLAWSEAGDEPYDHSAVPAQLHVMLERAGEHGKVVIAGMGLGASFARIYAARYRDDTAALVLIDEPASNDPGTERARTARLVNASPWLARAGLLRATQLFSRRAVGLPGDAGGATRAFLNRPDHLTRAALELSRVHATAALAARQSLDPQLPVMQLSTGNHDLLPVLASSDQAAEVINALKMTIDRVRTGH